MFDTLFEDGSLQDYINQNTQDPWVGTNFEGYVLWPSIKLEKMNKRKPFGICCIYKIYPKLFGSCNVWINQFSIRISYR